MHGHEWNWSEKHFAGRGPFRRHGRGGLGDWHDMFGGAPPRAERGVVRYLVLDSIEKQSRHGYEIMQAIEERSAGAYRPSPGVIYPTLQMLEELGHAKVEEREGRKVYAITADGKKDLTDHREEVDEFYESSGAASWEEHADDFRELMKQAGRLFRVCRRAARRGFLTPSTMRKLRLILDETLAKIEAIVGPGDRA